LRLWGIGFGGVKDGETTDIILVYESTNGLRVACEVLRRCHDNNGHRDERYREGQTSVGLVSKGNIANCVTAILRFLYHRWGNINRDFRGALHIPDNRACVIDVKYLADEYGVRLDNQVNLHRLEFWEMVGDDSSP